MEREQRQYWCNDYSANYWPNLNCWFCLIRDVIKLLLYCIKNLKLGYIIIQEFQKKFTNIYKQNLQQLHRQRTYYIPIARRHISSSNVLPSIWSPYIHYTSLQLICSLSLYTYYTLLQLICLLSPLMSTELILFIFRYFYVKLL